MVNHPNRGWRSRWSIDLETATVTHRDGWVFKFAPVSGEVGEFDGKCVGQPSAITQEMIHDAQRIAREAGNIYIEARHGRKL